MRDIIVSACIWLALCVVPGPADVFGGTYASTGHGTDADRRVIDADFPYTTKGLCAHCHDQHASIDGSEPVPPAAEGATDYELFRSNFGFNKNELCFACHDTFSLSGMPLGYGRYGIYQGKTKFNASVHYSSANMVWSPDASPPGPPFSPTSAFTDAGNCHNCHNPHGYDDGSGLIPQMLFARDSKTGDSPAYEMGCEACHDGSQGGVSKDVQAQLNKTYAHPVHTYNDRHILPETGESQGGKSFGNPPIYDKRHAECVDCHNPHTVISGTTHTEAVSGNAVSDVLKYVWGVEPSWPGIWSQPTSFTVRKPPAYSDGALYEYQICLKCHSYYGLGMLTNAVSTITGPSGTLITDQAWEFNRNNKSAHPVVVSLNNQTGSGAPKALTSTQLNATWSIPGSQTMYCSDCHGADNEGSAAKGPHGSARKYMLKGTRQYWPFSSSGKLFSLNDISGSDKADPPYNGLNSSWSTELFCLNCHDSFPSSDKATWKNRAHEKHSGRDYTPFGSAKHNVYCIACHSAVPHGNRRSRLIVYMSEPAPYTYRTGGNNYSAVAGFTKASTPANYSEANCYSTINGCSSNHPNAGGYDP